jgi:hypothetical protein
MPSPWLRFRAERRALFWHNRRAAAGALEAGRPQALLVEALLAATASLLAFVLFRAVVAPSPLW